MRKLNYSFVVKADSLKAGKGVKVMYEHLNTIEEALEYCKKCIDEDGKVIVEEKLVGQEFSMMFFCDGVNIIGLVPSQDHKRAYENDEGPNTGGMGSYSDANHLLPFLTDKEINEAYGITQNVCNALRMEFNEEYKGVMYGGFILTKNGTKLLEYNARLGDPEAMNVLSILKTDFIDLCMAVIEGTLYALNVESENKATVCKYIVPEGYPDAPVKNEKIKVDIESRDNLKVYYAAVDKREDSLYMTGSRAVAVVGIADTIYDAEKIAEEAASKIKGKVFHRKDIGTKELIEKRVRFMRNLLNK